MNKRKLTSALLVGVKMLLASLVAGILTGIIFIPLGLAIKNIGVKYLVTLLHLASSLLVGGYFGMIWWKWK